LVMADALRRGIAAAPATENNGGHDRSRPESNCLPLREMRDILATAAAAP